MAFAIETSDLQRKVRVRKAANLILFVVDASWSMAVAERMSATKGAILSLLTDAYQRRDRVGLIVFQKDRALTVLPPTNSVQLAQRALADIPVGGKTPLSAGLRLALETLQQEKLVHPDVLPLMILLTDGAGNVSMGSLPPQEEAHQVADLLCAQDVRTVVDQHGARRLRPGPGARRWPNIWAGRATRCRSSRPSICTAPFARNWTPQPPPRSPTPRRQAWINPWVLTSDSPIPFSEAEGRVTEALKLEGFGVLTRIDVRATFQEKMGKEFRPYVILGACNPPLAHCALENDPRVGLLLPCNVVVEQRDGRGVGIDRQSGSAAGSRATGGQRPLVQCGGRGSHPAGDEWPPLCAKPSRELKTGDPV